MFVPKCIFAKCTRLACLLNFASLFGSNGICVNLMKPSECRIELNTFDLMFDCITAAKIRLNFFQLCFKNVGGVGAASEVILTTRSRVVCDPQEKSLQV